MQLGEKMLKIKKNREMVQYEYFNNIKPTFGLMTSIVYDPPVSPKAIS